MKISARQIIASAVGAVLAALFASLFGVKGTVIGVAIGSVVATTGTAVAAQSLERTHQVVRQVVAGGPGSTGLVRALGRTRPTGVSGNVITDVPAPHVAVHHADEQPSASTAASGREPTGPDSSRAVAGSDAAVHQTGRPRPSPGRRRRFGGPRYLGAVGAVFAVALLLVTGAELVAGEPLSRLFGVHGSPGSGASVANLFDSSGSTTTTTTTTSTTIPTTTTTTSGPPGSVESTTTLPTGSSPGASGSAPGSTTTTTSGSAQATTTTTLGP